MAMEQTISLRVASSHHAAAERQYHYPNDYGGQKPPTSQWTVTGAGCALLAKTGSGPKITSATIGKVVDMGITDPFNMGGAMAPAAVETIVSDLQDRNIQADYYDLIVTGDLGEIGRQTSLDLLKNKTSILRMNNTLIVDLLFMVSKNMC